MLHTDPVRLALQAALPFAESRAEDMHQYGGDCCPWWQKANAAVDLARAVLSDRPEAEITRLQSAYAAACRVASMQLHARTTGSR